MMRTINILIAVCAVIMAIFLGVSIYLGRLPWIHDANVTVDAGREESASGATRQLQTLPIEQAAKPRSSEPATNASNMQGDSAPAWMMAQPKVEGLAAEPGPGEERSSRGPSPAEQAAIDRLMQLQASPDLNARELAAAIGELERAHGSATMHGVKLDVLRNNLEISQKLQKAASQLEAESKASDGKRNSEEFLAKVKEVEALQRQLRTDILVTEEVK